MCRTAAATWPEQRLVRRRRHAVSSSGWQGDNAGGTARAGQCRLLPDAKGVYTAPCAAPVFANHYVKTPVLSGVTGQILGRIINRSGSERSAAQRDGQPDPLLSRPTLTTTPGTR